MTASTRTTIWVGENDTVDIYAEDDMIMVEDVDLTGNMVEILICPAAFPKIREVMDNLEEGKNNA